MPTTENDVISKLIDGQSREQKLGLDEGATPEAQYEKAVEIFKILEQAVNKLAQDEGGLQPQDKDKKDQLLAEGNRLKDAKDKFEALYGDLKKELGIQEEQAQGKSKKQAKDSGQSKLGNIVDKIFGKPSSFLHEEKKDDDEPLIALIKELQAFVAEMQKELYADPAKKVSSSLGAKIKNFLNKEEKQQPAPTNQSPVSQKATPSPNSPTASSSDATSQRNATKGVAIGQARARSATMPNANANTPNTNHGRARSYSLPTKLSGLTSEQQSEKKLADVSLAWEKADASKKTADQEKPKIIIDEHREKSPGNN